jgi:hypothetical protein
MVQRTTEYSAAIKDVNPGALVFGPVNYGWQGMVRFQDAADANDRDFLDFYLASMASASSATGRRLLDVLDVHWYPAGQDITTGNASDAIAAARKQVPRSLWDPTYTENSWIAQYGSLGPIRLIPRLREKIAAHYPGTRLAITEYNYGGGGHISGAIAQADVLGVFGREGLFAATLWPLDGNNEFIDAGFDMFRNYDGANGSFGGTSIRATSSDVATASVYASVNAGHLDRMFVVAINKSDATQTAAITITHGVQLHRARVYQLTVVSSTPQRRPDIELAPGNAFQYAMPPNSVSTLVLQR